MQAGVSLAVTLAELNLISLRVRLSMPRDNEIRTTRILEGWHTWLQRILYQLSSYRVWYLQCVGCHSQHDHLSSALIASPLLLD